MEVLLNSLGSIARKVLDLLPDSPFRYFIDQIGDIPFLGYLNYFVPVSDFVILLTAWTIGRGSREPCGLKYTLLCGQP